MPLTQAGYRIVAIDAPAHGRSPGRLSSIVHFTDALEATAGLFGPVHAIIAHSLGAAAVSHAMMKGFSVKRAVFVAPQARFTGYWHLFRRSLGMSEDAWQLLRARSERWLKIRYDQLHPIDSAPRIKTPLLVLHGEADRLVPFSEGEMLARSWPGAQFRALGGGHMGVLRDWQTVIAATAFVAS